MPGTTDTPAIPSIRSEVQVTAWQDGRLHTTADWVAGECPVALVYEGVPYVVMLATPSDLEDFAVGFTLTEALVRDAGEIRSVEIAPGDGSVEIRIGMAAARFSELLQRHRNLTGRTGCGLCGVESVADAIRPAAQVGPGPRVSHAQLQQALSQLRDAQSLNQHTGSVHAAAWIEPGNGPRHVREDVGRHNALDKTVGALVRADADRNAGFLLITSRASSEMVQKATTAGISFLVAVSAPTELAIRLARESGLTLVGFAREGRHVVYANPARLV